MKRLSTFLAVLLALTALGAAPLRASAEEEPVTLVLWEGEFQKEGALKEYIRVFTQAHPEIRIEYDIKSSDQYISLLNTALQSGDAPDIFWTHGAKTDNMPNLARQGYLYDMKDDLDFSLYEEAGSIAPSVCYVDGGVYCTPAASIDTRVMYYNVEIFAAHGYEVPATLAEFEALCDKMLADGVTPIALGASTQWGNLFILDPILAAAAPDWMRDASAGKRHLNDPEVYDAYAKYIEWGKKGYFGLDYLATSEDAAFLAFATGKTAMISTGTWNCATIKGNNPNLQFGVFKLPTEEGVHNMVATPNSGYSIYARSQHIPEAVEFCKFLTSLQGQQIFIDEFGAVPELPQLTTSDPVYAEMGKYDGEVFGCWYDVMLGRPTIDGSSLQSLWEESCVDLLAGVEDLRTFLDEIDALVDYDQMTAGA